MDFDRHLEHERIKNDPQEVPVIFYCDECGHEIYKDNDYYDYDNEILCENCLDEILQQIKEESYRIAGDEDYEGN